MPMFTTSVMVLSLKPRQRLLWIRVTKSVICARAVCTSRMMFCPSTITQSPIGRRRAVCSTGRFSEALIRSPSNIARAACSTPASRARLTSSVRVSVVIRFFE